MEYRIGETFQWGDDLLKTVADTDESLGCEQCYFYHSADCCNMVCMKICRGDDTDVHFEIVMGDKVKMEIECDAEYIKQVCEAAFYVYSNEDIANMCKSPVRFSVDEIDWNFNENRIVLAALAYYMYLKKNNK